MTANINYSNFLEKPHVRRLTMELVKVEENIDNVRKMASDAIRQLEEQKRQLRKETDPNATFNKKAEEIDDQILDINQQKDMILEQLIEKHAIVKERKLSIDQLEKAVSEMDREISHIQAQHDNAISELEKKKSSLLKRLASVEKLDVFIMVLTYKIFETQHNFQTDMEELLHKKDELLRRTDLTESQMAFALAELERQISDRKNIHEAALTSLKGQQLELRKESFTKTQHIETSIHSVKSQYETLLANLEAQKLGASPSEIKEINKRIAELNRMSNKDIAEVSNLQGQDLTEFEIQELLEFETQEFAAMFEQDLNEVPLEVVMAKSDHPVSPSEAETIGLPKEVDVASWNSDVQDSQLEEKHLTTEASSTEGSSGSAI